MLSREAGFSPAHVLGFGVHHGFKTLANLRNVHAHNHLECLTLAYDTKSTGVLERGIRGVDQGFIGHRHAQAGGAVVHGGDVVGAAEQQLRSEERRVGKECRSRWSPYH